MTAPADIDSQILAAIGDPAPSSDLVVGHAHPTPGTDDAEARAAVHALLGQIMSVSAGPAAAPTYTSPMSGRLPCGPVRPRPTELAVPTAEPDDGDDGDEPRRRPSPLGPRGLLQKRMPR